MKRILDRDGHLIMNRRRLLDRDGHLTMKEKILDREGHLIQKYGRLSGKYRSRKLGPMTKFIIWILVFEVLLVLIKASA